MCQCVESTQKLENIWRLGTFYYVGEVYENMEYDYSYRKYGYTYARCVVSGEKGLYDFYRSKFCNIK